MSTQTHKQKTPSGIGPALERIARMAVIGVLAGIAAGVLVGGIAGRLIMRILAMVNDEKAGVMTENGNISGDITVGGTFGLIIFVGFITGVNGGPIYVLIRRWLPGGGLLKGLVFGLLLLCFFGSIVFDPENVDFVLFGPRELNVALFALLFLLYGVVASIIVERFDRYVPPLFMRSSVTALGYLLIAGLAAFGLFHTVLDITGIL